MSFCPSKETWETANLMLKGAKDGIKLRPTAIKNADGLLIAPLGREELFYAIENYNQQYPLKPIVHTTHSFIMLGKKIFAMTKDIIPIEKKRKIIYAFDEDNVLSCIKRMDCFKEGEDFVLKDRGLSAGIFKAKNSKNAETVYYAQMKYLGRSLDKVVNDATFCDEMSWDIAIKACLELLDLHVIRRKSLSKTYVVHHDLSLCNLTLDENGQVHFIDFEEAANNGLKHPVECTGKAYYQPHIPSKSGLYNGFFGYTGENIDVFGLKRVLKMPKSSWISIRNPREDEKIETYFAQNITKETHYGSILTDRIWDNNPQIHKYIDTTGTETELDAGEFTRDNIEACSLAAILIATRLKLSISVELLAENQQIAMAICAIYSHSPNPTKDAMEKALSDVKNVFIIAAFFKMDQYENKERYLKDTHFCTAIAKAQSYKEMCVLILLKSYHLSSCYSKLNQNMVNKIYNRHESSTKNCWTKDIIIKLFEEMAVQNITTLYTKKAFYDSALLIVKKLHLATTSKILAANNALMAKVISTIYLTSKNPDKETASALRRAEEYSNNIDFCNVMHGAASKENIFLVLLLHSYGLGDYYCMLKDIEIKPIFATFYKKDFAREEVLRQFDQAIQDAIHNWHLDGEPFEAVLLMAKKFQIPLEIECSFDNQNICRSISSLFANLYYPNQNVENLQPHLSNQKDTQIKACLMLLKYDLYNEVNFKTIKEYPNFAYQIMVHADANRPKQIQILLKFGYSEPKIQSQQAVQRVDDLQTWTTVKFPNPNF